MKIHLLNDHTALLMDDKADTVTITPAASGTLRIDNVSFHVEPTGTVVPTSDALGYAIVIFTDDRGVVYKGINPRYKDGVPYTSVDFTTEYFRLRILVDNLERQIEEAVKKLHTLEATYHPNALGFLTGNTKKTEE